MTYKTATPTATLDDDVANYVMGWVSTPAMEKYGQSRQNNWRPSQDMAQAWEALEHFIKSHDYKEITILYTKHGWLCGIQDKNRVVKETTPTPMEAICKVLVKWEKGRV